MNKHPWETAYKKKLFFIDTIDPSVVVKSNSNLFHADDNVLDIGCGNGRNAMYLATLGCMVDAFDIVDLSWFKKLKPQLKKKINFTKQDINQFSWKKNYYDKIILTRVIQYLSPNEIQSLFYKISDSLKNNGILLLSYSVRGGIQNHKEIKVPKFSHSIKFIKDLLEKLFTEIRISRGSSVSVHVNFKDNIESYDIAAFK